MSKQRIVGRRAVRPNAGGLPGAKLPNRNRPEGRARIPGGTLTPAAAEIPAWLRSGVARLPW